MIRMHKFNALTGEEIPTTAEEQAEVLASIRQAIEAGKIAFSDQARDAMADRGVTAEVVESWFFPKN